jgi:hypothetical protein
MTIAFVPLASASANLVGALTGALLGGALAFGFLAYYLDRSVRASLGSAPPAAPRPSERSKTPEERLRWATPIYLVFLIWSSAGVAVGIAIESAAVAVSAALSLAVAVASLARIRWLDARVRQRAIG